MADFNKIKDTVLGGLGVAAGKTVEFAGKAADKAKDASKIAKLSFEVKATKDTIEKTYAEIGKLYYDLNKNNPADYYIQLCEEITAAEKRIVELQQAIEDVKLGNDDDSIEVEFTEVNPDEPTAKESDFVVPDPSEAKPEGDCGCNG